MQIVTINWIKLGHFGRCAVLTDVSEDISRSHNVFSGDYLVSVNNKPTAHLTNTELETILSSHDIIFEFKQKLDNRRNNYSYRYTYYTAAIIFYILARLQATQQILNHEQTVIHKNGFNAKGCNIVCQCSSYYF